MAEPSIRVVANNKKAYHDYFVEDKYETGIELSGTEVKSIRKGNVNLKDSYCVIKDGEIRVHGMHILSLIHILRYFEYISLNSSCQDTFC